MKDNKKSWIKRSNSFLLIVCFMLLGLITGQESFGQSNIPILSWRTHFSYSDVKNIARGDNKVFAATDNAIFYFDQEDNSINLINKNTGLSGVGISAISFDQTSSQLIIGYADGTIDFWANGNVSAINTIRDAETTVSKRIRSIESFENKLYFSGDLGIVVFDLGRNEITEAYQNLGSNGEALTIYQTSFANDSIYAATESGILSASLSTNTNRQDFNNWQRTLIGVSFQHISQTTQGRFASADNDLFIYNSGDWAFNQNFDQQITALNPISPSDLFVLTENELWLNSINGFSRVLNSSNGESFRDLLITNGQTWIGSSNQGLLQFNALNAEPNSIKPQGPSADILQNPAAYQKEIHWIDALGSTGISNFNLEQQTWGDFQPLNGNGIPIDELTDINFGIVNESTVPSPIFSSFDQGLFAGQGPIVNLTTAFPNGSPPEPSGDGSFGISSMASQDNDILWITVSGQAQSLYSLSLSANEWTGYSLTSQSARSVTDLFVAPDGSKWMSIDPNQGGGILVFDETTGRERSLNTNGGQGGLPGPEVTDFAIDENLFLWVGTNQGIAFFPNPFIILENRSLTANIPIFENRLLLRDEFITQVVIDPANRKWFGTKTNGLWLFNETGEVLVHHFTTDNSPLPSDHIVSLFLDPPSGELFIGTDKGLVSFRSDATAGTDQHSNVKIYPNPVNPTFQGEIVINGLANNALVKITDVSGKLVREVRANGSTSLWNARDINGKRVKAGVYLVFSSSADGTETFVGKIVVI